jgi:peptide chain release factor 1
MFDKLQALENRFQEIEENLSDPGVIADHTRLQELSKERAEIHDVVESYRLYRQAREELDQSRALLEDEDAAIREMARTEIPVIEERLEDLEAELRKLLVPKDPMDPKNVILEVRSGTGGDEAALFAGELVTMYLRFAEEMGWKVDTMSLSDTEGGGVKEAVLNIKGRGAYGWLKYESGVHRVQRVPVTESQGRIHTSAATVAVLPEAEDIELSIADRDLKVEVMRASGAGGQHVNTTDSAVRLTHIPSGIVVHCRDERSQHKNRAKAMKILRSRLLDLERRKRDDAVAQDRRSMVGTGDRSEKIRTYNFPQDRITDHRIGYTRHNLDGFMAGDISGLIGELRAHAQAAALDSG